MVDFVARYGPGVDALEEERSFSLIRRLISILEHLLSILAFMLCVINLGLFDQSFHTLYNVAGTQSFHYEL